MTLNELIISRTTHTWELRSSGLLCSE